MPSILSCEAFTRILSSGGPPLLDVRSPSEFAHAHIPGAVNLPLMDDDTRHRVGIAFKEQGREAAIVRGFDLAGSHFGRHIEAAREISPGGEVLLYCWRGGMRSGIMGWLLRLAGFRVTLLQGGYKAFRRWAVAAFAAERPLVVVGGKTGSGKTELLGALHDAGEQVIDLEKLACHKGSAFGGLGQPPQPGNEQFENLLAMQWAAADPARRLWIENESRLVGSCLLPEKLYHAIRRAPVVELELDRAIRRRRILDEYGGFPVEKLKEKTGQVKKRLGGLRCRQALDALDEGRMEAWCDIMLDYYDGTYAHSNAQRPAGSRHAVRLPDDDMPRHLDRIVDAARKAEPAPPETHSR